MQAARNAPIVAGAVQLPPAPQDANQSQLDIGSSTDAILPAHRGGDARTPGAAPGGSDEYREATQRIEHQVQEDLRRIKDKHQDSIRINKIRVNKASDEIRGAQPSEGGAPSEESFAGDQVDAVVKADEPGNAPGKAAAGGRDFPLFAAKKNECANGCGFTAFGTFSHCCTHCRDSHGTDHAYDCSQKNPLYVEYLERESLLTTIEEKKYDEKRDERRNRYTSLERAGKQQYDAKERAAEKKREEADKAHNSKCRELESKIRLDEMELDYKIRNKDILKDALASVRAIYTDDRSDDREVSDTEKGYILELKEASNTVRKQQSRVNELMHELVELKQAKEDEDRGGTDALGSQGQSFAARHPAAISGAFALLYYIDLFTDVGFVTNTWGDKENTRMYGIMSLISIVACPLLMSVADLMVKTGMGWKGVVLNFSFTRMLYTTYRVAKPTEGETAASAGKANTDCKLIEALIESVPQLFIQLTALFSGVIPQQNANGRLKGSFVMACISVIISFLSIVSFVVTVVWSTHPKIMHHARGF